MDITERYLRELLFEAKEIKKQLEHIRDSLEKVDKIEDEVNDIKRTLERKERYGY